MAKELKTLLDEARAIAAQPTEDRLDGKQGDEAGELVLQLLKAAGLTYLEAVRLTGARDWQQWKAGWAAGHKHSA